MMDHFFQIERYARTSPIVACKRIMLELEGLRRMDDQRIIGVQE